MPVLRHLYIVEAKNSLVKIGYTATPEKRFKEICRSNGTPIVRQYLTSPCINARELERSIHHHFAAHRQEGEWFKVSFEAVLDFLEKQPVRTGQCNDLMPFDFRGHTLRTYVDNKGNPWFCLKDTSDILEIENSRDILKRLKEKGVDSIYTLTKGGMQKLTFIDEANFYRVIFQSRKAEAETFQDWVFEEVLPSIRKTGQYTLKPAPPSKKPEQLDFEEFQKDCFLPDPNNVLKARDIYLVYQEWCQRKQRPIYKPQWLGTQLGKAGYRWKKGFKSGISCWCGFRLNSPICTRDTEMPTLHRVVHDLQNYLSVISKTLKGKVACLVEELISLIEIAHQKSMDINPFLI